MEVWSKILANKTLLLSLVFSTLILVAVLISKWSNRKVNAFMASIPGPLAIPILGCGYHLLVPKNDDLFGFLQATVAQYPRVGRFWVAHEPYIFTGDRKIISAVLKSFHNVQKTNDYDHFKALSMGIFVTNGPEWRRMRKIINPSYKSDVLASFDDGFSYQINMYLKGLHKHADKGQYFDLFVPTALFAIDSICENIMRCRMDVQRKNQSFLATNLLKGSAMAMERAFSFLLWPDIIYSLVGKQKESDATNSTLRALAREMLEIKLNQRSALKSTNFEPDKPPQTLIEILLNHLESGDVIKNRASEEIVETLVGGTLTTAISDAWTLKILAMRPDIQKKVHQEIVTTVGRRQITLKDLSRLVYLDMVVKETLRHFAIPIVTRHLVEDLQIDENMTIPAGIRIVVGNFFLHHDAEYWERPGDFYPEHFSPENEAKRLKGCYFPFLAGPRVCPGSKYGTQSIKLLIANAILNFEFSTDESMPVDLSNGDYKLRLMVFPKSGFNVRVKRRFDAEPAETE